MSRPKIEWRSASRDNYTAFCKLHPKVKITYKQFCSIIYKWNELFMNNLLDTGDRVKLPYGLGPLCVTKYRQTKYKKNKEGIEKISLAINWVETKKLGKRVYITNFHTEGYKFYWAWVHREARFKCSFAWRFKAARVHSRKLASYLKDSTNKHTNLYKQWVDYKR